MAIPAISDIVRNGTSAFAAGGGGSANVGSAILNFGAAPGTNVVETVVIGQAAIVAGSSAQAFLMGAATATHNAYEHAIVPVRLTVGSIVAGTGFTITAVSEWRLNGTFNVYWIWN